MVDAAPKTWNAACLHQGDSQEGSSRVGTNNSYVFFFTVDRLIFSFSWGKKKVVSPCSNHDSMSSHTILRCLVGK